MHNLPTESYGPLGDPSRHRPLVELAAGLCAYSELPKDEGRLATIVRRRPDGERETPDHVTLTPEGGVPGDRWGRLTPQASDAQLTVMRRDVAELVASGQPLTLFGDNLFVDLDISAENLPLGARLLIGEAVVEVTPMPHNGCHKFKGRFGQDALEFVNAKVTRHLNLRGMYWKVVKPGQVCIGDAIQVLLRA